MIQEALDFEVFAHRLRMLDNHAAAVTFERFVGDLTKLVRRNLWRSLQSKLDPEDVVQSTFRSFFMEDVCGKCHFEGWDAVWGMLSLIAVRKCSKQLARYRTASRDVRRELDSAGENAYYWGRFDRNPSPTEKLMLAEATEQLLDKFDAKALPIVVYILEGRGPAEISGLVDRSERTVQRIRSKVEAHLETMLAASNVSG